MSHNINIPIRAARRAGAVIIRYIEQTKDLKIDIKGKNDFVSDVDRQAEAEIIDILRKAYPDDKILAEETGESKNDSDYKWIIDPLDGTTNFLHGHPYFSVSIALQYKDRLEQAVVYDPLRDELYTAIRGKGALLNDRRIRVTGLRSLDNALIGTGFPFKMPHHFDCYMDTFKALYPQVADVRRAGSAAIDLAYVAAGRLDGFWEIGLQKWDMAAGALLIQEAGGLVSDFSGGQNYLKTGNIVAASPKVFKGILQTIQPHLSDTLKS